MSKIGNSNIAAIYKGSTEVVKAYLGNSVVYEKASSTPDYLAITALEPITVGFVRQSSVQTLEYSYDGNSWATYYSASTPISLSTGDKVCFRGKLNGNNDSSRYSQFNISGRFNASGKLGALINYESVDDPNPRYYSFENLFRETQIVDASGLIFPPRMEDYFCYLMFYHCTYLTHAPELPNTSLKTSCYDGMFSGCASLVHAPSILPATTLATTCYNNMFRECTSLVTAPVLPATTLAQQCYRSMFYRSSNVANITCLATDISAWDCTLGWLRDVAANGTFTKNSNMSGWPSGNSGIPEGWTVQDYQG